jgi:BirA family biotin operon repressor/biotin-[acetyl-CoA-carboxylase] ligase
MSTDFATALREHAGGHVPELEVMHLAEVPSTNSWLLDREAAAASAHAVVVVAERQTAGRGQHGRSWFAAPGASLALSYLPRPSQRELDAPRLSMATAVAAREALAPYLPAPPRLKWPNDLFVDGRKLAGILVESRSYGARRVGPVIGLGINLAVRREDFPEELRELATSIALVGGSVPERSELAGRLVSAIDRWLERARQGEARVLAAAYLGGLGFDAQEVEVESASGRIRGRCVELDLVHGLVLSTERGPIALPLTQVLGLRALPAS